jgi:hypothetical protein
VRFLDGNSNSGDAARLMRRLLLGLACAAAAAAALALTSGATADRRPAKIVNPHALAHVSAKAGRVLGGSSEQRWPVVFEMNSSKTQVDEALAGLSLPCAQGGELSFSDGYRNLSLNNRRFGASFGPEPSALPNGGSVEFSGAIDGRFKKGKRKASGTWQLTAVEKDPAGAIVDTCDSGEVEFTVKQ